jgi:tetratricopeptide (TPR) repeat protein
LEQKAFLLTEAKNNNAVVDLDRARAHLRSRGKASAEELSAELEAIRELLDRGLTSDARARLDFVLPKAVPHPAVLAEARCLLSIIFNQLAQYRDSLAAVSMYEAPEARANLDPSLGTKLTVRIALAYSYNADHPKAIALLKAALRPLTEDGAEVGSVYSALALVYRKIAEYNIARDYTQRALGSYRQTGDWRGLSEAYAGLALADMYEGHYESSLAHFEQSAKLIGDRPASFLLGRAYSNMAGACWFLKRPHDGIRYLEKGISYLERTEHKAAAADGYNNLGINLILIGQWDRGQQALERALALASEADENYERIPMILDSLGELRLMRGDLDEAKEHLDRAVDLAHQNSNKWYQGQALRTLSRCYLAMGQASEAVTSARQALELAQNITDRQAICESRLILAEASLAMGDQETSKSNLDEVAEQVTDSTADLLLAGGRNEYTAWLRCCGTIRRWRRSISVAVFRFLICSETVIARRAPIMNSAGHTR